MKKHLKRSVAVWAVIGIFLGGVALAQVADSTESPGFGRNSSGGFGNHPPRHPGHLLSRAIHENVVLEVLTEMTGKDAATVKADMQTMRIRAVLESYGIDRESFRSRMHAGMAELVNEAASCGLITQEQASEIGDAIKNRAQGQPGPAASGEEG